MRGNPFLGLLVSIAGIGLVTGVVQLAKSQAPVFSLGVLYVFAVLPIAVYWGLAMAVLVAVASVLTFDYLFIPPIHSFHFGDAADWSALAVYVVTAVVVSGLAARTRRRADVSEEARAVLADERAALRRVAVLVARQRPADELFATVAAEVGNLLEVDSARLLRYESHGASSVVAGWSKDGNWSAEAKRLASGSRDRHEVSSPIVIADVQWGEMVASSKQPLGPGSEARIANFTELVATAIANAQARAELANSRARVVAAADDSRRRLERDLHDGTQQRLVSLGLELQMAQSLVPEEAREARAKLDEVGSGLMSALDDLREISRGIHPAILSRGGLGAALRALARRSVVPVEMSADVLEDLPDGVEIAAYYVVSEALANAARYAEASVVTVSVERVGERLRVLVTDDGVGGADPTRGTGLIGLADRVGALGGTITVTSPRADGTRIVADLPLAARLVSSALRD
jgi:signal transduction histidine kinase